MLGTGVTDKRNTEVYWGKRHLNEHDGSSKKGVLSMGGIRAGFTEEEEETFELVLSLRK